MARRLDRALGPQGWWPARTPFEVMVGAVLTQNAAWTNVERAVSNLRGAGALSLNTLFLLPRRRLEGLIRPAGYFRVKTRRLLALCRWLDARCAGRLARLEGTSTEELRQELLAVKGVGPETADSILLYALGRPVFVVDAYTRRVLTRHSLSRESEPYDSIRARFERALGGRGRVRRMNELHAQVVALAKAHCRTRPVCEGCPLEGWPGAKGAGGRRARKG
jgi:endonuclease-3 related protein